MGASEVRPAQVNRQRFEEPHLGHYCPCTEAVLRNYFRAKDENRPHLLERVFEPDAQLMVVNHADSISLPAYSSGREGITDVLVRNFGQTYENIYSYYLSRPQTVARSFSCGWLVAMSEKEHRTVRVGCGRYDWAFARARPHLATHLTITIQAMQVLPPADLGSALAWVQALDYPGCSVEAAARASPRIASLAPVLRQLAA